MEIPTNKQISHDMDEIKQSNHSFATSTPAHKQIKYELGGVSGYDQGENELSPAKAVRRKDMLSKLWLTLMEAPIARTTHLTPR